ncbi:MAG: hypothetical protein KDA85_20915, partial [Planctomycetaceae bacterium]|nr:hypothetical protein [Planctomycetaceae bacterium]
MAGIPVDITQYAASLAGSCLVEVCCEKCNTMYYYQLSRIGAGTGVAIYNVRADEARKAAHNNAAADLLCILQQDAELVPCPHCQWINESLVQLYRSSRYPRILTTAWKIMIIGSVSCLIAAWYFRNSAAADRWLYHAALWGGPVASIAVGLMLLGTRRLLQSRIIPNLHYPALPELPPGTPPALIWNPTTQSLEVACGQIPEHHPLWHDYQVGRHTFRPQCVVCSAQCSADAHIVETVSKGIQLPIPVCATCLSRRTRLFRGWFTGLMALSCIGGLVPLWTTELPVVSKAIVSIPVTAVSWWLGSKVANILTRIVRIKTLDASRALFRMKFNGNCRQPII